MILRTNTQPTTPCLDCGTRHGAPYKPGNRNPARTRSLCLTCYEYHRQRGTLAQFPKLGEAGRRQPRFPGKLRHPGERRAEQRARIAARVARHDHTTPVIEGDDFDHMQRRENALRTAAAWLATHAQAAEWDHPNLSESLAANAETRAA